MRSFVCSNHAGHSNLFLKAISYFVDLFFNAAAIIVRIKSTKGNREYRHFTQYDFIFMSSFFIKENSLFVNSGAAVEG